MSVVGLATFVLVASNAEAAPVKLNKQQVQTVCDGGSFCIKDCGLKGDPPVRIQVRQGQMFRQL
jgi:hypothetical protein